jgi:hypothetical protein
MNGEIYTPYAVAAGMLLHTNGKFTMGKLKSPLLSESFVLNRPSLSIMVHENEDKQNKDTMQYVLDTTIRKQTQITQIRQITGGKDEPNIVSIRKSIFYY